MIPIVFDNQPSINELSEKVSANLNPDLRELTAYVRLLELPRHGGSHGYSEGSQLQRFLDTALMRAMLQIAHYKELEAPLTAMKASSLRAMSAILDATAKKARERSEALKGVYRHPFHIFFEAFGPDKIVPKNSYYGYKAALTRYSLKRIMDLMSCIPTNVDNAVIETSFQRSLSALDTNVDNVHAHPVTRGLTEFPQFQLTERNPKLSVYPWFAARRHLQSPQIVSTTTSMVELIELAECIRFICYYPPDLKYERRGFAGKKRGREFDAVELVSDGLLLSAPKPSFEVGTVSKRSFDKMSLEQKNWISTRNKRIGSTAFDPTRFWNSVVDTFQNDELKASIAAQIITGCRPAELVHGIVAWCESDVSEVAGTSKITFLIFGAKTLDNTATPSPITADENLNRHAAFLSSSSIASNARIRGQFFHMESFDVLENFPERVWLHEYLTNRGTKEHRTDAKAVARYLDQKLIEFRRLRRPAAVEPPVLPLAQAERMHLDTDGLKYPIDQDDAHTAYAHAPGKRRTLMPPTSTSRTLDYEAFLASEMARIRHARANGSCAKGSALEMAKILRFAFTPHESTFPLMCKHDGITYCSAPNRELTRKTRIWLLNEFSVQELNNLRIPADQRSVLSSSDFAQLEKERAEYRASAVVRLSERYHTAYAGEGIDPTPYTARHRLLSDLKGLKRDDGSPALSKEDIARKAGHASTVSQTGYGKADYSGKGPKNRAHGISNIASQSPVKDPSATAGKRARPRPAPQHTDMTPKYEPRD